MITSSLNRIARTGILLLVFIVTSFSSYSYGQLSTLRFKRFSMDDNLSQNSIHALIQDSQGFIWAGTQDGLNRYDGYTFTQYHYVFGDSMSLADDYIWTIYEDNNKDIWIGTQRGGMHKYNPSTENFTRYPIEKILTDTVNVTEKHNEILGIVQVGQDSLLLGTGGGLVLLETAHHRAQIVHYAPSNETTISALTLDQNGHIWISDYHNNLYQSDSIKRHSFENLGFKKINYPSQSQARTIKEDNEGNLWVATHRHGVFKRTTLDSKNDALEDSQFLKVEGLASDSITTVFFDEQNRLWVGYQYHGLGITDLKGNHIHYQNDSTNPSSLSSNWVYTIIKDRNGVLWVGTWNGLNRLSPQFEAINFFRSYQDESGVSSLNIISLEEDRDGIIWLGTGGGSLLQYDRSTKRITKQVYIPQTQKSGNFQINEIYQDSKGYLWIITHGGVYTLDTNYQIVNVLQNRDSQGAIQEKEYTLSVLEVDEGEYWFGTRHNGLKIYDSKTATWRWHHKESAKDSLISNYIWALHKTRDNDVWIGAYDGGLIHFDKDKNQFNQYPDSVDGLTSNRIFTLFEDSKNDLWIGTAEGLNKLDRRTMTYSNYQPSNGLPHGRTLGILEDDSEHLWISTNDGLSRFNPRSNRFKNYYAIDGLQGNRFYARSALRLKDGNLLFGGPNGLNLIKPHDIYSDSSTPNIVFTGLEINNELKTFGDVISQEDSIVSINHTDRINFSFSVLDFTNIRENRYHYKLEPLHKSWQDNGDRHSLSFAIPDHGNYTLSVRGANSDGMWSEVIKMPFKVIAPFWERPWFRLLTIVSLAALIMGGILLRTRYILGIANVRLGIAKSLHDDLGGNLSTISIQTGILQTKNTIGEKERKQLERVSNMARETAHKVREAVWLIDAEYDTLDKLVTKIKDSATTMLEGNILLKFKQSPLKMPVIKTKMNFRENIYFLVKEALNNANKYSKATTLWLIIELVDNELTVQIEDDGTGFDADKIKRGNGLKLMQQRANEIKGHLKFNSVPGIGTTITLKAKVSKSRL